MPLFCNLVMFSSQIPLLSPLENLFMQLFKGSLHKEVKPEHIYIYDWLLELWLSDSRASLTKWEPELRLLKKAQTELSIRQSGEFCQMVQVKSVGLENTILEQITYFPRHFFQEKSLQPSTIDGYRLAIADKADNSILNITGGDYHNRLLDASTRIDLRVKEVPPFGTSLGPASAKKASF